MPSIHLPKKRRLQKLKKTNNDRLQSEERFKKPESGDFLVTLFPEHYRGLQGLRGNQIEAAPAVDARRIRHAQSTHFCR